MNSLVSAFAKRNGLAASSELSAESDVIVALDTCRDGIDLGYAKLPETILESDFVVGLLWQLYRRVAERVEGAAVLMVAGNAAASEIVSRAAIEACATFQYILGDRFPRMASFMNNHVRESRHQEQRWRKAISDLDPAAQSVHITACDYRLQGIDAMDTLVSQLSQGLVGTQPVPGWPNISQRFEAIGDTIGYRTLYARLCSEPHLDAEETIRAFLGIVNPAFRRRLEDESVAFSRLMLAAAGQRYAAAGVSFANAYTMTEAALECSRAEASLNARCLSLSTHTGSIPTAG